MFNKIILLLCLVLSQTCFATDEVDYDSPINAKRLENKVAIVTGGASGIGRATCLLFAKHGARVAITDINQAAGVELESFIRSKNGIATFYMMDITKEADVEVTITRIAEEFEGVDVLVNNAGVPGVNKPSHEITEAEWDSCLNLNTKGVFLCNKYSVPYMMKKRKGSVINMSSVFGLVGSAGVPPYHAAKGAIRIMTKSDACQYGKYNIRFNSIHPSSVRTPMTDVYATDFPGGVEEFYKKVGSTHLLERVAEPKEIAFAILFLASDEASFITGTELMVDGGFTAGRATF
ncbi:MAG: SDR family oxidoreductase [Alphaproteobacteria bacterium]|nr:SDR family oxidoreductase [Alphaproteobacteria bacterium]